MAKPKCSLGDVMFAASVAANNTKRKAGRSERKRIGWNCGLWECETSGRNPERGVSVVFSQSLVSEWKTGRCAGSHRAAAVAYRALHLLPVLRLSPTPIASRLLFALFAATTVHAQTFDVLIRGGFVVDGTGAPWMRADVGITGDRIVAVGKLN